MSISFVSLQGYLYYLRWCFPVMSWFIMVYSPHSVLMYPRSTTNNGQPMLTYVNYRYIYHEPWLTHVNYSGIDEPRDHSPLMCQAQCPPDPFLAELGGRRFGEFPRKWELGRGTV